MKKSNLEETKQKCRLGTASNEITGGLPLVESLLSTFVPPDHPYVCMKKYGKISLNYHCNLTYLSTGINDITPELEKEGSNNL